MLPVDNLGQRMLVLLLIPALSILVTVEMARGCQEEGEDVSQDEVLHMTETGSIEPFPAILEKARGYREGKLLEAKLDCIDQRYVYEIDMLDHDGQIRALRFDAVTGRHLDLEED